MVTKHWADLPVRCSCFPLAIYFTFGSVYYSMPLSHFIPAYPSPPHVLKSILYICVFMPFINVLWLLVYRSFISLFPFPYMHRAMNDDFYNQSRAAGQLGRARIYWELKKYISWYFKYFCMHHYFSTYEIVLMHFPLLVALNVSQKTSFWASHKELYKSAVNVSG